MAVSPLQVDQAAHRDAQPETRASHWVTSGIIAGLLGGTVVAVFFLIVDWIAGRPFWTPHALGSALFLAERVDPTAPPDAIMIVAYSIVHGVIFIAAGVPAASEVYLRAASMRTPAAGVALGAMLFTGFEIFFLLLGQLFFEGLIDSLGVAHVTIANALAAAAMAAFLWARARRRG